MVAFLLATEMVGIKERNLPNGLMHAGYGVGLALQAFLAYLVRDWRHFNLLITLPNIFFVLYLWYWFQKLTSVSSNYAIFSPSIATTKCYNDYRWMPESPRWLVARGRTDDADKILEKIAKQNKQTFHKEMHTNMIPFDKAVSQKTYHLGHLFSTKRLAKITIIQGFAWYSILPNLCDDKRYR